MAWKKRIPQCSYQEVHPSYFKDASLPDRIVRNVMNDIALVLAAGHRMELRELCRKVRKLRTENTDVVIEQGIRQHLIDERIHVKQQIPPERRVITDDCGDTIDECEIQSIEICPNDTLTVWFKEDGGGGDAETGYLDIDVDDRKRLATRHGLRAEFGKKDTVWKLFAQVWERGEDGASRNDLMESLWPGRSVQENNLDQHKRLANDLLETLGVEIAGDGRAVWRVVELSS